MKKMLLWLLAACILQAGIYEYLDQVLFAPAASFSEQAVGGEAKPGASVYYSHDNAYYAQVSDSELKIYSSKGDKLVKDNNVKMGEKVTYFSWLPERNLALVGVSEDVYNGTTVSLQSINPETNSEPVSPKISGLSRGAKIVSVAYSTETNVTNMLIKSGGQTLVYRTDANNTLRRIYTGTTSIRRIASLLSQNVLLYDDIGSGKVYLIDEKGRRAQVSPQGYRYALVGVDKEDKIYLARLKNSGVVSDILVGKVHGVFGEF